MENVMQDLMQFLDNSVTSYHAVEEVTKRLSKAKFELLSEKEIWSLKPGKKYMCQRNDSSIMAFVSAKDRETPGLGLRAYTWNIEQSY